MKVFLARKGIYLSKTTIHKYMNKSLNLHSVVMRKKPSYSRDSKGVIFSNLLQQKFKAIAKNKIWCTDFTYIRLANGKMRYNCTILDLYDRSVVSTCNSKYINTELATNTITKAIACEKPGKDLILHSDQGSQFTSSNFINSCKNNNIIQSMSKAGCPYDNAPMERYYNTFKNKLIYRNKFYTESCLEKAVNKYAFVWYNHIRPHSYNSGLTPFESRHRKEFFIFYKKYIL